MPAKDIYHETVKIALEKEGWEITDDPLYLRWGGKDLYIDLGAEDIMRANLGNQKIAVEIKSFVSKSEVEDLKNAIGQYILYHDILKEKEPDRTLYLAIREKVYENLFEEPIGKILLQNKRLKLITFEPSKEVIVRWIE